jgi:hypothetical protein
MWVSQRLDGRDADQVACWDTPPPVDSELYPAFKKALGRYLRARTIVIPVLNERQIKTREAEAARQRNPPQTQPDCVVGGVSCFLSQETSSANPP